MKPAFPLLLAGLLAAAPLAAQQQRTDAAGPRGGELLLPTPADPQTFNPIEAADNTSQLVAGLTMADLMHTNPHTLAVEPALALRVEHRTPRLWIAHLRRGLLFSDGAPFTAADVVFSFQVWTDPRLQTAQFDLLRYNGAPVVARALDDHTVEFDLPGPAAVGDRLFDSVWILPRHRLQAAYAAGKLDQAWGAASAPGDIAGLGPFTIASFSPGQELRLARNPHYWRTAADGQPLPLLAGVRLRLIPDPNLQVRLLLAGQLDALPEVRSQDLPALEKQPCCRVLDGGPGLDVLALALNYSAAAPAGPRAWFAQTAVRRSISAAVDRANLARNVFHGAATPIATFSTPALGAFADRVPVAPADAAAALALLRPAGFTARRGQLYDADGRAVTFSLIVQAAHPERVAAANFVQADLARLGMRVQVVPLDAASFVDRLLHRHDYEMALLGVGLGDVDPNPQAGIWPLDGAMHVWNVGGAAPLPWERQAAALFRQQHDEPDPARRAALFQQLLALERQQMPLVPLLAPNILAAVRQGLQPAVLGVLAPHLLWDAAVMSLGNARE